jgi:hypothetical protein
MPYYSAVVVANAEVIACGWIHAEDMGRTRACDIVRQHIFTSPAFVHP